jgi:hypothetical protein
MATKIQRLKVGMSERVADGYQTISITEMMEIIEKIKAKVSQSDQASIRFEVKEYGYDYDPNSYHGLYATWERLETDDEYELRVSDYNAAKASKELRERAEFERLSKLYGKKEA